MTGPTIRGPLALCLGAALAAVAGASQSLGGAPLHYAANGNFDPSGAYLPARAGFNLADVSYRSELDQLPEGVKGLVWIGECAGATETFRQRVESTFDHPRTFGYYLVDEPDPTGKWNPRCAASDLRAEADWIHQHAPGAKTFVVLMMMGSPAQPWYNRDYLPERSHVDLFGIDPYPCRTGRSDCDLDMIDRFVDASLDAGYPLASLVPVYHAYGGGPANEGRDNSYSRSRLPAPAELWSVFRRWDARVPSPAFDYAYSWGRQSGDLALDSAPELQAAFQIRNRGQTGARPDPQ